MNTSWRTPLIHNRFWFCMQGTQFLLDHFMDPFPISCVCVCLFLCACVLLDFFVACAFEPVGAKEQSQSLSSQCCRMEQSTLLPSSQRWRTFHPGVSKFSSRSVTSRERATQFFPLSFPAKANPESSDGGPLSCTLAASIELGVGHMAAFKWSYWYIIKNGHATLRC